MAADLFRRNGWDIQLKIGLGHDELVSEVRGSGVVVIGLSASGERSVDALSRLLVALRISNPDASIFLGGNIIAECGNLVDLMDVDGLVPDIRTARTLMAALAVNIGAGNA